jgi:hypothetical protein
MMRLVLTLAVASLVLPTAALGKGPSAATIDGPGTGGGGLTITGCCSPGSPTMMLAEQAGFFPAVFRQTPDPMLTNRPQGDLGPKYTITYTVPGPNNDTFTIRQDVYPYASPSPVTYTAPAQKIFDGRLVPGGPRPQADARRRRASRESCDRRVRRLLVPDRRRQHADSCAASPERHRHRLAPPRTPRAGCLVPASARAPRCVPGLGRSALDPRFDHDAAEVPTRQDVSFARIVDAPGKARSASAGTETSRLLPTSRR